jgi:hypothetical protein
MVRFSDATNGALQKLYDIKRDLEETKKSAIEQLTPIYVHWLNEQQYIEQQFRSVMYFLENTKIEETDCAWHKKCHQYQKLLMYVASHPKSTMANKALLERTGKEIAADIASPNLPKDKTLYFLKRFKMFSESLLEYNTNLITAKDGFIKINKDIDDISNDFHKHMNDITQSINAFTCDDGSTLDTGFPLETHQAFK